MPRVTPATPAAWIATGCGLTARRLPAPGTVGGALGVPIWLAVSQLPWPEARWAVLAALVAFGAPLCGRAARELVALGVAASEEDPQAITYDEFVTAPIVYAFAPAAGGWWLAGGFALHRLFDITKPWPCRALERLPGGWGIMADDVMAALYAGVAYRVAWQLWG